MVKKIITKTKEKKIHVCFLSILGNMFFYFKGKPNFVPQLYLCFLFLLMKYNLYIKKKQNKIHKVPLNKKEIKTTTNSNSMFITVMN